MFECGNINCEFFRSDFLYNCKNYAVLSIKLCANYKPTDDEVVIGLKCENEESDKNCVERDPDGIDQHSIGAKTTPREFDTLLKQWLERIERVLGSKAGEYAQNGDRLFNFRQAALINNQTMPQALWGMASKHLVSVMDLVEGRLDPKPETVHEKCTDLVNYIILLSAVLLEGGYGQNK